MMLNTRKSALTVLATVLVPACAGVGGGGGGERVQRARPQWSSRPLRNTARLCVIIGSFAVTACSTGGGGAGLSMSTLPPGGGASLSPSTPPPSTPAPSSPPPSTPLPL